MLEGLLQPEVQRYIRENEKADVHSLLLKNKPIAGVTARDIAAQINGRIKAKLKLPEWYSAEGIIYPVKLSMEQCSSELTAKYKSQLISGTSMVDLTGGAGVDCYYFKQYFDQSTYVEQNPELYHVTLHNFRQLAADIACINDLAENVLEGLRKVDVIYLDPARRDEQKKKVFRFEDCTPDVSALLPDLLAKGKHVLIKTAPFLDIQQAVGQLSHVAEIHVVAVNNECKEVLYLLSKTLDTTNVKVRAINLFVDKPVQKFSFTLSEEVQLHVAYSLPLQYIYEPNAAIMKSGGFNSLANQLKLAKLHPNTHLYTSEQLIENFPGRTFELHEILKYDRKSIKRSISSGKANITTRNFPNSVAEIRKKTGLKDGGEDYLFAVTLNGEKLSILRTSKISFHS